VKKPAKKKSAGSGAGWFCNYFEKNWQVWCRLTACIGGSTQKNAIGTGLVVLEIKRPVNAGSGSRGVAEFLCQAAIVLVVNP
jgi:hypothetical protein